MTQADQIRHYVIEHYIEPARAAGKQQITIRAGDIHTEMQLKNRMPNVCSSLDAQKFYDQAAVTLVKRSGPKQSSTAEWIFALVQVNALDLGNQTPAWERTPFTFTNMSNEDLLPMYGGNWGSEPIVINRWSATIDIDLESFEQVTVTGRNDRGMRGGSWPVTVTYGRGPRRCCRG